MLPFADILLLSAVTILAPSDGAEVPLLADVQKRYLAAPHAERVRLLEDAVMRQELAKAGEAPQPVELRWSCPSGAVCRVEMTSLSDERTWSVTLTNRTSVRATNFIPGRRYAWSVVCGGESDAATFTAASALPRLVYAGGVHNLRDLGGWRGLGGLRVREGMLLRSAGLRSSAQSAGGDAGLFGGTVPGERRITDAGIVCLRDELKIRTDLELRNDRESAYLKESVLGEDVTFVRIPFAAYDFIDRFDLGRRSFAKIFRQLLDSAAYPVLFHCSGGRDRTGTLSYLLLALLGVGDDDLRRDWEATAFGDASLGFTADRLQRLEEYLATFPGASAAERVAGYAKRCGIRPEEIARFRAIMLEQKEASR